MDMDGFKMMKTNNYPLTSIMTCTFNSEKYLKKALDSIQRQTYKNIEHIIVDGASTDGTLDVLEKYRGKLARVISEPDRGIYDAMNKGLRLASGDVIGFLNADDMYTNDKVIEDVTHAMSIHQVDAVFGDLPVNLEPKIALFAENCRLKQRMMAKK